MTDYNILRPWETLDEWQKEYIKSEGNCFLLCGRQVGKTTAAAIKAAELAIHVHKKGEDILMIALTERQAYNLFNKTLNYIIAKYPNELMRGKFKPTLHHIFLKNGVKIMCHPTGLTGEGLRTYTLKKIFCDEASRVSDSVFTAITPMLAVTKGSIDVLSTPCGKQGYFYECSKREDFKKFYVSSETCERINKEHLEREKKSMSKLEYAQEYLGVFLDELKRFFSDELIRKCCILSRVSGVNSSPAPSFSPGEKQYFLGVDVARMGEDECRFEIFDRTEKLKLIHVDNIVLKKVFLNEVYNKILELDRKYVFKSIYIDDGGIGVGVFDYLLENEQTKRKVVAINNRARPLDYVKEKKKKILKEDLYNNLLGLMERGEIQLLNDDSVIESLKSVQYEYAIKENLATSFHIFSTPHSLSHCSEGLIRAAWCVRDKRLNIWIR